MDFTKKENDEAYIEKQRQRQYERTIRNKKREIAMLKQTGAEPSYIKRKQNSLSNTRKEYLDFLDKTGIYIQHHFVQFLKYFSYLLLLF